MLLAIRRIMMGAILESMKIEVVAKRFFDWPKNVVLIFLVLIFGFQRSSFGSPLLDKAANFSSEGMAPLLAICHLPDTCNSQRPNSAKMQARETGNDNLIEEHWLVFDGLQMQVVYVMGNGSLPIERRYYENPYNKPVLLSVLVTGSEWPVLHGLRVGSSRSKVEGVLGKGVSTKTDECVDYTNAETQDEVTICYARKRIRSIKWSRWWDG